MRARLSHQRRRWLGRRWRDGARRDDALVEAPAVALIRLRRAATASGAAPSPSPAIDQETALSLARAIGQTTDRLVVWQMETLVEYLTEEKGMSEPEARRPWRELGGLGARDRRQPQYGPGEEDLRVANDGVVHLPDLKPATRITQTLIGDQSQGLTHHLGDEGALS